MAKSKLISEDKAYQLAFEAENRCYKKYDGDYDRESRRTCAVRAQQAGKGLVKAIRDGNRKKARSGVRTLLKLGKGR